MTPKLAVVAIGGNSLILDPKHPDIAHQWDTVRETCRQIAQLTTLGWNVVITHGNGPQVGHNLRRVEYAEEHGMHAQPLDLIVAETQGSIGYMLQQAMSNSLRRIGINRTVLTVVTQVRVDANDADFEHPTKPVGDFMSKADARAFEAKGWRVIEDAGRGWRRVVPSPMPRQIIEQHAIRKLIDQGYMVIACGGGGIPVIRNDNGSLRSVAAVIDKDHASSLLAQSLNADLLLISTGVERIAVHYRTPQQHELTFVSHRELEQYQNEGHFPEGSMGPKIDAVLDFIRHGGPEAIITDPPNLIRAVLGETGTHIQPG